MGGQGVINDARGYGKQNLKLPNQVLRHLASLMQGIIFRIKLFTNENHELIMY